MKIISFNVNGIRAIAQKNFFSDIETINPDILCLQETKATVEQVKETVRSLFGYEVYANEANKKGYSGTAILTKKTPIAVSYGIGEEEHDTEGRVTCLEFEEFFLVNVYVPNSGGELARLGYRQEWDSAFLAYLKKLEVSKHVLVCGDLNVAHKAIDGMDNYHADGLIDTFRFKYPEQVKYTWWSYRGGARERNVGWRIDYFLASERFLEKIEDAFVFNEIHGSDHCPVGVKLHLS